MMALGRGEYPKWSTPLGLFQRAVTVFFYTEQTVDIYCLIFNCTIFIGLISLWCLSCLCPLVLLLPKLAYLAFQSFFDFERHLMKVIPETRRALES
jgi:hypothetical protein